MCIYCMQWPDIWFVFGLNYSYSIRIGKSYICTPLLVTTNVFFANAVTATAITTCILVSMTHKPLQAETIWGSPCSCFHMVTCGILRCWQLDRFPLSFFVLANVHSCVWLPECSAQPNWLQCHGHPDLDVHPEPKQNFLEKKSALNLNKYGRSCDF